MAEGPDLSRQLSMHVIDPSPVEDSPREQRDTYFPSQNEPETSPSQAVHRSHSLPWYLARIQRYSSYTFAVFTAMHITNTSLIPLITRSVPVSEPYLLLTRPYYQSALAEPLVVAAPLLAHVGSGIALRLYHRRTELKWYGAESRSDKRKIAWPKLSGTSLLGYMFMPLLAGHVLANRVVPLQVHGGSSSVNLGYVSHAFAKHPAISFFGFGALVIVGVAHSTWGTFKWLRLTPMYVAASGPEGQLKKSKRWWLINAAAAAVAGIWLAGALGVIGQGGEATGWVGKEYDELYSAIPIVGKWL